MKISEHEIKLKEFFNRNLNKIDCGLGIILNVTYTDVKRLPVMTKVGIKYTYPIDDAPVFLEESVVCLLIEQKISDIKVYLGLSDDIIKSYVQYES